MAMSPKVLIQRTSGQYWQPSGDGVGEGGRRVCEGMEEVGDGVGEGGGGEGWVGVVIEGREGVMKGGRG